MNWPAAEELARAGQRVRRAGWRSWRVFDLGEWFTIAVGADLTESLPHIVTAAEVTAADDAAEDWTTDPLAAVQAATPLGTITLSEVTAPTLVSFGVFAAGIYRVVYEQGAFYYVATAGVGSKSQLRINAFSSSYNGFRIRIPGGSSFSFTASASTNVFTAPGHTFAVGDEAVILAATGGGTNITLGRHYAVLAVSGDTFQLATAIPNVAIAVGSDITAGTIKTADLKAPGYNESPADGFRYADSDSRTEAELLAEIAAVNGGRERIFTHPGGEIAMYLSDDFTNNAASAVAPRFSLYAAG